MIGRDCRCPGCGTCDAASEADRLRKLADSKNGQRIAAEHRAMAAERERDELKSRLAHARQAARMRWPLGGADAQALEGALTLTEKERDALQAKLDAELPAMWREDIASLNECLDRVGRERDEARAQIDRREREHEALVETAQKALAHVAAERDELRAQLAFLREEYGVNADNGTLTRDALEQKIQVLTDERRQLRARLVECRAWAGCCPYPNTPKFDELMAIRALADDTLEEVKP